MNKIVAKKEEIVPLVEELKSYSLAADELGLHCSTVRKAYIRFTGHKLANTVRREYEPRDESERFNRCPINRANKICKKKGFKDALDYIANKGRTDFIFNIKPLLK